MPTVVTPESYGAVPDGRDCTLALQQALNAAGASGAVDAEVHLSSGTYGVSKALVVPAGVHVLLRPEETGVSILKGLQTFDFGYDQSAAPMLVQVGGNDVSIEKVTIDCTDVDNAAGKLVYGVFAGGVSGLVVRDCLVKGALGGGAQVHLVACTHAVVENTEATNGRQGIQLSGACEYVSVTRCRVHHVYDYGIYVVWAPGEPATGNTPGVSPTASNYVTVAHCEVWDVGIGSEEIKGCPRHPIYFVCSDKNLVVRHRNARVINNLVTGNDASYLPSCTPNPPPPSSTWGTGTADNIGIYQCQDAVVVGNHSTKGGDLGIALDYSDGCTVAGNVCSLNDTDGIGVWRSRGCIVSGNVCYNNGQWRFTPPNHPTPSFGGIGLVDADGNMIVGNRCYDDQASKTQSYGIVADAQSAGNVIAGNYLGGNASGPSKLDAVQMLGLQYDGDALVATPSLGFAGATGVPDVSLGRIAPYVLRATGYLAVGDQATGVGGTLNVRANGPATEGVNIRGVTGQTAALLRVQAHNGTDYLRVGPVGASGVAGATSINGTLGVTGATSINGTLGVTGATSISGALSVTPSSATTEGVKILGVTGQTADLLRVQAQTGSPSLRVGAGGIGFLGKAPVGVQPVSGTTADEKLNSLLRALDTLGLIEIDLPQ